jgi:transaldolase
MPEKSVVERLWEVNPDSEIWWDSSPLIYDGWRQKMMDKAADKEEMKAWLDRFYNENNDPEENLFRGVTTNPPLSHKAIKADPNYWARWIEDQMKLEKDKPCGGRFLGHLPGDRETGRRGLHAAFRGFRI